MKGTITLVIGGIAVAGVAALVAYKRMHSQKEKGFEATSKTFNGDAPISDAPISDYEQVKKSSEASIKERHEEAAKIIKQSLENIFIDEVDEANHNTPDNGVSNHIGRDLDDLLN